MSFPRKRESRSGIPAEKALHYVCAGCRYAALPLRISGILGEGPKDAQFPRVFRAHSTAVFLVLSFCRPIQ